MKNLVNHRKWADEMPSRQRFHEHAHIGQRLKANKEYRGYYSNGKWKRANRILIGCNGKSMSYVYSRLKPIFRGYKQTANEFLADNLDKFVRWTKNGKRVFVDKSGKEQMGNKYWGGHTCWEENGILHVDNFREIPIKPRFDARKYYSRLTQKRKFHKQLKIETKEEGLFALKLINKPTLFPLYVKLKQKQKFYIERLQKETNYTAYRKDGWWYMAWMQRKRRDDIKELKKIREDLEILCNGDFNKFFKSAEYMYSLYKECHHVAPTPHLPKPLG